MTILTLTLALIIAVLVVAILIVRHRQQHPHVRAMVQPVPVREDDPREGEILRRLETIFAHTVERQERILHQQRSVMEQLKAIRTGERGDNET